MEKVEISERGQLVWEFVSNLYGADFHRGFAAADFPALGNLVSALTYSVGYAEIHFAGGRFDPLDERGTDFGGNVTLVTDIGIHTVSIAGLKDGQPPAVVNVIGWSEVRSVSVSTRDSWFTSPSVATASNVELELADSSSVVLKADTGRSTQHDLFDVAQFALSKLR